MEISQQTARRYILGRQGLWPGRRWQGPRGTERAMRAMEHLQLDPLLVMGRAQDLMLQARVIDYRVDDWQPPLYEHRRFFEWGGWLAVRPMEELPYWRVRMRRERDDPEWHEYMADHQGAIEEMRALLERRGRLQNRDFSMHDRVRTDSYYGRKDSALALYYLWRIGEAMVHHRERFEKIYAPAERVAPRRYRHDVTNEEADAFHWRKQVAFEGLTKFLGVPQGFSHSTTGQRRSIREAHADWRAAALERDELIEVRVDGWKGPRWALGEDADTIRTIEAGRVPRRWRPLDTTTTEEVTFLSPLDPVSARDRATELFDFHYRWEVYTPAPKRRWGYYTLPVLWGDRLVARFDGRFDPGSRTLRLLGMWFEDDALVDDDAFLDAFAPAMTRFARYLDALAIDSGGIPQSIIRHRLQAEPID
jgi:uncharacterized protein YcaQ